MPDLTAGRPAATGLGRFLVAARGTTPRLAVAEKAGVSNAYLLRLEDGRIREPSPHMLRKIAAALAVGYLDLMHAAGYLTGEDIRQAMNDVPPGDGEKAEAMRLLTESAVVEVFIGEPCTDPGGRAARDTLGERLRYAREQIDRKYAPQTGEEYPPT